MNIPKEKTFKETINIINDRATKNLNKRWYIIVPIFLIIIIFSLFSLAVKVDCIYLNDQSNYFSANVFYFDVLNPTCITLEKYDDIYLDSKLFDCLKAREDYSDPFKCIQQQEVLYYENK